MPANEEKVAGRRRRLALWMVLLVAALGGVWCALTVFEPEPSYQRRSATEWLDIAEEYLRKTRKCMRPFGRWDRRGLAFWRG